MKQIIILCVLVLPIMAWSADNNDDEDYDSIVRKLTIRQSAKSLGESIFDNVMFHVGLGVANTAYTVKVGNDEASISKQGFSLALGVDLFSPKWLTEVVFSNYGDRSDYAFSTSLKEFDLKVIYKYSLSENWDLRIGTGLAARYLNLYRPNAVSNYTTPSSILLTGVEAKLSSMISLVTEIGLKSPVISETPERSAFDLLFRIDGHL